MHSLILLLLLYIADDGLSGGAIAGIVVGVLVPVIVVVSIAAIFIYRRRSKGQYTPRKISMKKVSTAYNRILSNFIKEFIYNHR